VLGVAKLVRAEDQCPRRRLKRTIGQSLNQGDGISWLVHHTEPSQVCAHDADDLITDLFGVHDRAVAGRQQGVEFREEVLAPLVDIVTGEQRNMAIGDANFVVGLQVVRCTADVDDAMKVVFAQPNDFLLSPYFAVTRPESTGSLADGQLVLDDPDQVTRLNTERPLAAKLL